MGIFGPDYSKNPVRLWGGLLDDRWECQVIRLGKYQGKMQIKDLSKGGMIHDEWVGFSWEGEEAEHFRGVAKAQWRRDAERIVEIHLRWKPL